MYQFNSIRLLCSAWRWLNEPKHVAKLYKILPVNSIMHVVWKRVHWYIVVFDGNKVQYLQYVFQILTCLPKLINPYLYSQSVLLSRRGWYVNTCHKNVAPYTLGYIYYLTFNWKQGLRKHCRYLLWFNWAPGNKLVIGQLYKLSGFLNNVTKCETPNSK
jgi:hypothetical protein